MGAVQLLLPFFLSLTMLSLIMCAFTDFCLFLTFHLEVTLLADRSPLSLRGYSNPDQYHPVVPARVQQPVEMYSHFAVWTFDTPFLPP